MSTKTTTSSNRRRASAAKPVLSTTLGTIPGIDGVRELQTLHHRFAVIPTAALAETLGQLEQIEALVASQQLSVLDLLQNQAALLATLTGLTAREVAQFQPTTVAEVLHPMRNLLAPSLHSAPTPSPSTRPRPARRLCTPTAFDSLAAAPTSGDRWPTTRSCCAESPPTSPHADAPPITPPRSTASPKPDSFPGKPHSSASSTSTTRNCAGFSKPPATPTSPRASLNLTSSPGTPSAGVWSTPAAPTATRRTR
ncbi:hypothetical protein [Nocardioides ochotonae]|uniref:hypothetical protein n=1 Tax=Nocardioides ochotonae TaxID=2685869 RepID=UPI00140CD63E|nr:hypothetical protein [Nocardioides ochotonae]